MFVHTGQDARDQRGLTGRWQIFSTRSTNPVLRAARLPSGARQLAVSVAKGRLGPLARFIRGLDADEAHSQLSGAQFDRWQALEKSGGSHSDCFQARASLAHRVHAAALSCPENANDFETARARIL